MSISFSIKQWSGWAPTQEPRASELSSDSRLQHSSKPNVQIIPPMLRRRLNDLGKSCAASVLQLIQDDVSMPVVYCSQHGDIERTLKVLEDLTNGEMVSPMHFSLAVHNAICGILSIHLGNKENVCSLAAGEQALVPALLEAAGILAEGAEKVLCVFSDVCLPDTYRSNSSWPKHPFAIAFVLSKAEDGAHFTMKLSGPKKSSEYQNPVELINFLDSGAFNLELRHNEQTWALERHPKAQ